MATFEIFWAVWTSLYTLSISNYSFIFVSVKGFDIFPILNYSFIFVSVKGFDCFLLWIYDII